jgi:hypothetical protein
MALAPGDLLVRLRLQVGADPHWVPGLDLMRTIGLDAVVIPHYDNAEGGTHDTRYCYLGERRLRRMEADLPETTWVLGVDEHTACVFDLDAGTAAVTGRGGVTIRRDGAEARVPAGETIPIAELGATVVPPTGASAPLERPPAAPEHEDEDEDDLDLPGLIARAEARFATAMDRDDVPTAIESALQLEEAVDAWREDLGDPAAHERARRRLRAMVTALGELAAEGLHDHRDVVAPYVDALIDLRDEARDAREFDTADRIRDRLVDGGVDVHDTPDGTEWDYGSD